MNLPSGRASGVQLPNSMEAPKQVHVVIGATNGEDIGPTIPGNPPKVRPQFLRFRYLRTPSLVLKTQ